MTLTLGPGEVVAFRVGGKLETAPWTEPRILPPGIRRGEWPPEEGGSFQAAACPIPSCDVFRQTLGKSFVVMIC